VASVAPFVAGKFWDSIHGTHGKHERHSSSSVRSVFFADQNSFADFQNQPLNGDPVVALFQG
jgi:hypothetical protein